MKANPTEILRRSGRRSYDIAAGTVLAFTGTSAKTPQAIGSASVREAYVYATAACFINIGSDPTAAATGVGLPLAANTGLHVALQPNDKIAAIQASTGGNLHIIPVKG